ncbi:unnamed protein product [Blepharisma stoltei]|uniref:Uncharacterized protein n=1 Tax=Blepharisma stoltei TaxID=1481888 RepID=A0AAU9J2B4_9CILI|nr:unnamed protein product [Blepharisma stoltei]
MDLSSTNFNNYDIEAAKRNVKCDSWLFLVIYFIPIILSCLIPDIEAALSFIFFFSLMGAPYWLTAVLGFFASSNEMSFTNCYSCFLKCTFIYVTMCIGGSILIFLYLLLLVLANYSQASSSLERFVASLLVFMSFLAIIHSACAFTLWFFANRRANRLKDLILRRNQYFQNPNTSGRLETKAQFFAPSEIEVGGCYPQQYPQQSHQYPYYNQGNYGSVKKP